MGDTGNTLITEVTSEDQSPRESDLATAYPIRFYRTIHSLADTETA